MKKLALVLPLALIATLCLAQSPPMPPGFPVKKKTVLLSPKAASQVTVRMAKMAAAPAVAAASDSTSGVTASRVPVVFAETDGTNVLSSGVFTALKFTSPNPTKGSFIIMLSDDLNNWHKIKIGTADDPLVLYDFTYLTQRQIFYKFVVDPDL